MPRPSLSYQFCFIGCLMKVIKDQTILLWAVEVCLIGNLVPTAFTVMMNKEG